MTGRENSFQLSLSHNSHVTSLPIYVYYGRKQIKEAIEYIHGIGNFSINFPNEDDGKSSGVL